MASGLICPRCGEEMIKGLSGGTFTGWRDDGMSGVTRTVKYMCSGCGYIEERAVNARYLKKQK
jgi:predicted RNA-binding Zn-ribbon protein involved in translation (DUF1610 family)